MNSTTKKRCIRCERLLPLEAFGQSKKNKDGHSNTCKMCVTERNRQRYRAMTTGTAMPELKPIKKKESETEKSHKVRTGVTCAFHCAKYPCMIGMSNLSCNLALTCHGFQMRS